MQKQQKEVFALYIICFCFSPLQCHDCCTIPLKRAHDNWSIACATLIKLSEIEATSDNKSYYKFFCQIYLRSKRGNEMNETKTQWPNLNIM